VNVTNIIDSYLNLTRNKNQFTLCSYNRNIAQVGAVYSTCNANTFFSFYFAILGNYISKVDTEIQEQSPPPPSPEFGLVTDNFHKQNFLGERREVT